MNNAEIVEKIVNSVISNIPADVDINSVKKFIAEEMSFIDSFDGIKILNSTNSYDDGVFIYHRDGFVIVNIKNGIAKTKNITEDILVDIMTDSYICKYLSLSPKNYSREIKKHNKKIIKYL